MVLVGGEMCSGADSMLRERLPQLWRSIEDAHYSYLQIDDSPEKLQQRKKLEGYIREYLSLVPHECKFGLSETGKVFQRTVAELPDYSAYRAGLGWAALARYAANLLAQPWRKEYTTIRLYCGYYKHEVEANLVGAEMMLGVMGYRLDGPGRVSLDGPVCPDFVAAVSRDALIAYVECQMMAMVWERAWNADGCASWAEVARERARRAGDVASTVARIEHARQSQGAEIYSNVKPSVNTDLYHNKEPIGDYKRPSPCTHLPPQDMSPPQETMFPLVQTSPYVSVPPSHMPHSVLYSMGTHDPRYSDISTHCNPMMNPYGVVPGFYYAPMQTPYMIPAPMYAPIKHANTVPINGYPQRYPSVPTAQLIELDPPSGASGYHSSDLPDGRHHREEKHDDRQSKKPHDRSRQHETSRKREKSILSDTSLQSIPRSDTQPSLSKAKEDGMGTYESWDYVFRNLSTHNDKEQNHRPSPPLERDSKTLERLEREDRRRFHQMTMDLEDGLHALNLDRSYDEEIYRTAKVNDNLMRLKQETELKKAKARRQGTEERERKPKKIHEVSNSPDRDVHNPKIALDKIRLISKKDARDKKEIQKQTLSNGSVNGGSVDLKRVKKVVKCLSSDVDNPVKSMLSSENGQSMVYGAKTSSGPSANNSTKQHNGYRDHNTHLIVSLDDTDSKPKQTQHQQQNGTNDRSPSVSEQVKIRSNGEMNGQSCSERNEPIKKWECHTCTYINSPSLAACEMCGKSRRAGPEVMPLTSGGRECPACTLVNKRDASTCEACATSLKHSPTYI